MTYIKNFSEISKDDKDEVGGKAASLGEITNLKISIPAGFVITTKAFEEFREGIPQELEDEILKAFDELGTSRVAVRSSAVSEDSSSASWAGQLESFLNIGRDNLIDYIKECWNSIDSDRAVAYAEDKNLTEKDLVVAVIVQKMLDSEASGVLFTKNPINNKEEILIEGIYGLGELIVQGMITPDNFIVDKKTLNVESSDIVDKETMLVFGSFEKGNIEVSVPESKRNKPCLTKEQIKELVELGIKIEKHFGSPQDIEWAIEGEKVYILQSRPITTA